MPPRLGTGWESDVSAALPWAQFDRLQSFFRFTSTSNLSTTWGICFSLKGNSSSFNPKGFVTVLPRSSPTLTEAGCLVGSGGVADGKIPRSRRALRPVGYWRNVPSALSRFERFQPQADNSALRHGLPELCLRE